MNHAHLTLVSSPSHESAEPPRAKRLGAKDIAARVTYVPIDSTPAEEDAYVGALLSMFQKRGFRE